MRSSDYKKYMVLPLLGILMLAATTARAQDTPVKSGNNGFTEDKSVHNEIGFDMLYFVNIFHDYYESSSSTIFTLAYNRDLAENLTLRLTLGSGFTNLNFKQDTLPGERNKIIEELLFAGLEWDSPVYHRWQLYYGADMQFQYGYTLTENVDPQTHTIQDVTDIDWQTGPGPFFGLIFYINPRVSISTETYLNFIYLSEKNTITGSTDPADDSSFRRYGWNTVFTIPNNLFLNIKF